jgi:hypothetical protein
MDGVLSPDGAVPAPKVASIGEIEIKPSGRIGIAPLPALLRAEL